MGLRKLWCIDAEITKFWASGSGSHIEFLESCVILSYICGETSKSYHNLDSLSHSFIHSLKNTYCVLPMSRHCARDPGIECRSQEYSPSWNVQFIVGGTRDKTSVLV